MGLWGKVTELRTTDCLVNESLPRIDIKCLKTLPEAFVHSIILPKPPRAPHLCTTRSKSRHMTAEASAALGVPPDATTVSELAVFPFKVGMLKTSLFPPLTPFHRPISIPSGSVQVKAPTHG